MNEKTEYSREYPLSILQKVAVTPCRNPLHGTSVEFNDVRIIGADTTILCADCCEEALRGHHE